MRIGGAVSVLALLLAPFAAGATTFTLSSTVTLNQNGVVGNLLPVSSPSGTQTCGTASCTGSDILLFAVQLTSGSDDVNQLGAAVPVAGVAGGGGWFDDGGTLPSSATNGGSALTGILFAFSPDLSPAVTTDTLFVQFSSLTAGQTASFSISPVNNVNFSVVSAIVQVPEPTAAALVALALGATGAALIRRS